jgi:signal transduction histidine kinase/CheY-like chemotaxis protein
MTWPVVTMPIQTEPDVVAVRQRARHIAELLGFDRHNQTRIATAVSEIARNAFSYAGGGRAEFLIEPDTTPQMLLIRVSDAGKGIPNLDIILEGRFRSATGMGLGIIGAKRLMDRFRIETSPDHGTRVELGQQLSAKAPRLTVEKLADLTLKLRREKSADPLTILREQNRELMQSLEELRRREEERDQLSSELGDTNRGVVALYAELEDKAEQLRRASDLKSRFLSNMSHEFRTPLNSILALSRLLLDRLDGDLTTEQERQVGYIRRSAEGLLELVNDLLDLAKVEAGKVDIRPGPFTVGDLFAGLRGSLKPLQTGTAVELIFEGENDALELNSDEPKVAQILRNFISNALKFTEAGEVRVSAAPRPHKKQVVFSVHDTGIGIAPEDQQRIFEEFGQAESHIQSKVKGTGLGLALSRSLARLLGGDIELESVLGQGSVFRLVLPFASGNTAAAGLTEMAERKRILIIDDDETFRYLVRQIVSSETLYDVLEASGGEEGLRSARQYRPDMILLDLEMPFVDGFAVLRELRSDAATREIPVVISTSWAITSDLKKQIPADMLILPKDAISRETVSSLLFGAIPA